MTFQWTSHDGYMMLAWIGMTALIQLSHDSHVALDISTVLYTSLTQIGTSLFGGVINQTPKLIHEWPAISSSSPSSYVNFIRLEWSGSRSIVLHMPGGVECKYSL